MNEFCIANANVVSPNGLTENCSIYIDGGKIVELTTEPKPAKQTINADGKKLYSGFIDIHNHGAIGYDINESTSEELIEIGKFLATNGVTSWLPTLVPDSTENYQKVIDAIDNVMELQKDLPIAQVLGVHYEGVFANEKMCGALRSEYFKSYKNGDEVQEIPKLKNGIHFTTLAPEVENGIELIKELTRENWIVSIGHTKAETRILDEAFQQGARHLTHFFNAMTGLHHRDLGVVGWALDKKDVTFDIIADGRHIHPKMLKLAVDIKSVDKVSLISDSIAPTGLGNGDYEMWGEKISVVNGKTQNEKGSIAGSVITLRDALKLMKEIGFSEAELSKMVSLNSAKLLGMDKTHGSIEIGKRADLVVLDENENVADIFINGRKLDFSKSI